MSPSPTHPSPESSLGDDELVAALALAAAPGVGPVAFAALRSIAGSHAAALTARVRDYGRRAALLGDAQAALARASRAGATVIVRGEMTYPPALLDLPDPPPILFAIGDPATLDAPSVAIVGTRAATPYGERVARDLAAAFARAGACVVSGLARGIDAASHEAALEAGGRTVAVLGTGIDIAYPAAHRALHARIGTLGLLLSEHAPGVAATPGSFPRRNRIIAALAQLTVVVEAGHKSGALITAGVALDLDRTVAAVPGPIDRASAAGSNQLLRDGACVISSVDDALALLHLAPLARPAPRDLSGDARTLWDALLQPAPDVDTLASRSRLPARQCMAALTQLEMDGLVECSLAGDVRRR